MLGLIKWIFIIMLIGVIWFFYSFFVSLDDEKKMILKEHTYPVANLIKQDFLKRKSEFLDKIKIKIKSIISN